MGKDGRNSALSFLESEVKFAQNVLERSLAEVDTTGEVRALDAALAKLQLREREQETITQHEREIRDQMSTLKDVSEIRRAEADRDLREANLVIARSVTPFRGGFLISSKSHSTRLKDELLDARRAAKGEEQFIRKMETVREKERVKTFDHEEKDMVDKRDK